MATDDRPAPLLVTALVQFLKGCGPERAELLARLGVRTIRDLLFLFPRDYQDLTDLRSIDQFEEGKWISTVGDIVDVDTRMTRSGKLIVAAAVSQPQGVLRALWFNQPFMKDRLRAGQTVLLAGKPKLNQIRWEITQPQVRWLETDGPPPVGEMLPVYPLTEGLQQRQVRSLMRTALAGFLNQLDEVFPVAYLAAHDLDPIATALPKLHFPASHDDLDRARRRFIYQELLVLQLALAVKRQRQRSEANAVPLPGSALIDSRIRRLFPFEFTAGQNRAIDEIVADLSLPIPMNRLLQADVGSGKTVVAVYAMLLAVAHGAQAALMAPTEILAQQHFDTLSRALAASQVKFGLLTGGMSAVERRSLLADLAAGDVKILIGTQAILEKDVAFQRLALVVIDEQHKFGVRQRASLRESGVQPHYLIMTATPIPRTMAMTVFGDLDVSTMNDAPPNRRPVRTYWPPRSDWPRWWEFYRKKLRQGRQGYVIVPLVEDAPQIEATSLAETFESLANGELEAFRLDLLHGRQSSDEKHLAMERFRRGETQVLVATSVVEVGVDVPNATLMTVLDADRFGLAQLHQLRGRVTRGKTAGYCCLLAETKTPESQERLEALVRSADGFQLAEIDFRLRGPGEILGTRQHGLPPLRIADLSRDGVLLEEARRDAQTMVATDPGLSQPEHSLLRRMMLARYGQALELGDVG